MTAPSPAHRSKSIPRAVAVTIVIAALTGAVYVLVFQGPAKLASGTKDTVVEAAHDAYDLVRRIADDIDDVLHFRPRVSIGGETVIEAGRSIQELAVLEKTFRHTHTFESTWLGSTKRLEIAGTFRAKAGYDLDEPVTLDVSTDSRTITTHLPPPRILSVEQVRVDLIEDEDGFWNKISKEERESTMNALLAGARANIAKTSILDETEAAMTEQMEEIIRREAPPEMEIINTPRP